MTRLVTEWIADIRDTIRDREEELKSKTGLSYAALAAKAGGCSVNDIDRASRQLKVAVVPVTTGLGIIDSFAQSVAAVPAVMGFQSFITEKTDVDGLYEAYRSGADLVYMADDNRYITVNLNKRRIAENDFATALGYTAALEGALGSLAGKEILVLGCGSVGMEFIRILKKKGAGIAAYDISGIRLSMARKEGVSCIVSTDEIRRYRYIIDATSQGGWLQSAMLYPEAWIAAPGLPLSLDEKAHEEYRGRLIHDPLQIGTAAMLGLTL